MNYSGVGATSQDFQPVQSTAAQTPQGGNFVDPTHPNILDFLSFLTYNVQIPSAALPGTSNYPQYALTLALGLVLDAPPSIPQLYVDAVYNLATHILFSITPDQAGQQFFLLARSNKGFNLINPLTGLVASSSDESTSASLAVPEWATRLTISQINCYQTPWGRSYLGYNQAYGPTPWGLT